MHPVKIIVAIVIVVLVIAAGQTAMVDLPRGRNWWEGYKESLIIDFSIVIGAVICIGAIFWGFS